MKCLSLVLIMMFATGSCYSQSNSKKIITMLEQIAANAAHIAEIEKGYEIAREGLNFISNAKNGEFNLHSLFFASLQSISPAIKKWSKVADIIVLQLQLVKAYKGHYKQLKESNQFSATEINYIYSVFTKLIDNTSATLQELITITTANNYEMRDDERINRIDGLFKIMQADYAFEQQFGSETIVLAKQREQEQIETNTSRALNGVQ